MKRVCGCGSVKNLAFEFGVLIDTERNGRE